MMNIESIQQHNQTDSNMIDQYHRNLLDKARELETLIHQLAQRPSDLSNYIRIQDTCKGLSSTSQSLGFKRHSSIASSISVLAEDLMVQSHDMFEPLLESMSNFIKEMIEIAKSSGASDKETIEAEKDLLRNKKMILSIFSHDADLITPFNELNHSKDYEIEIFKHFDKLMAHAKEHAAYKNTLIIDLDALDTQDDSSLKQLSDLPQHIITYATSDQFTEQLKAARMTAKSFLVKPFCETEFKNSTAFLSTQHTSTKNKILLIHQNSQEALTLEKILSFYEYEVLTTHSYYDCLPTCMAFKPDIAIIDSQLKGITSIELANVLSQNTTLNSLACMLITANVEDPMIYKIHEAGYQHLSFPKDIDTKTTFIQKISRQLYKTHQLDQNLLLDPLTHLLTEQQFISALNACVSSTKRTGHQMCAALLQLDHLNFLNDHYGHWAGNRAIISLSHVLKNRLRKSDLLGHFHNHQIGIIMPNTSMHNAIEVIKQLNKNFAKIAHHTTQHDFFCSFSGGICSYPEADSAEEILGVCQERLSLAQSKGKNRIEPSEQWEAASMLKLAP